MIPIIEARNARAIEALLAPPPERDASIPEQARAIVEEVRRRGDRALRAFARRFDALSGPIEVGADEMAEAARRVPPAVRRAIRLAARHIRIVARAQVPRPARIVPAPGVVVEQRVVPLARVGCYVPAGRYPLPSSLLMTAIPARVAGVKDVIAVCPRPDATVMAAALEAGVTRLFRVGGAHAVAALAYGTASVPRVDKIVGPGNAYVSAAKAIVARDCAIDFYAGPSEIAIVSAQGPAAWIATDLIAQAEHDPLARAIFVTWSRRLAREVAREVALRAPATGPAIAALANCGAIVVARDRDAAIALADRLAPEHLVCDDEAVVTGVRAGTVFVGSYTAQAAGDYATGSNHVLPTGGAARFRGGLSAADFVRVHSVQRLTAAGLRRIAPSVVALAEAEGLRAHADSIRVRLS